VFDGLVPGTVLLLHAGIADHTMWLPQIGPLEEAGYRVLAPDLLGFGERPLGPGPFSNLRDVLELLDGPADVVGCSLGGRVGLELAAERPDLVKRLVVIAPGLPGRDWSEDVKATWVAEEAAFNRRDFDAAAEAVLRLWIDGPRRSPEDVDPAFREQVRAMTIRSYELQLDADDAVEEPPPRRLDRRPPRRDPQPDARPRRRRGHCGHADGCRARCGVDRRREARDDPRRVPPAVARAAGRDERPAPSVPRRLTCRRDSRPSS
jgi:pimeloyl-ACP methyl ester carboxylesterase